MDGTLHDILSLNVAIFYLGKIWPRQINCVIVEIVSYLGGLYFKEYCEGVEVTGAFCITLLPRLSGQSFIPVSRKLRVMSLNSSSYHPLPTTCLVSKASTHSFPSFFPSLLYPYSLKNTVWGTTDCLNTD